MDYILKKFFEDHADIKNKKFLTGLLESLNPDYDKITSGSIKKLLNAAEEPDDTFLVLNKFFTWLKKKGFIGKNPIDFKKIQTKPKTSPRDYPKIFDEIDDITYQKILERSTLMNKLVFCLMRECGLRLTEVAALNLEDIRGDMVFINSKANSRIVYLSEYFQKHITVYVEGQRIVGEGVEGNPVFVNRIGKRVTYSGIKKNFDKACKDLLLEDGSKPQIFMLRATYLIKLAKEMPIDQFEKIAGFKQRRDAERYYHD